MMARTLVTGGAVRLGKEVCLTLARAGHDLAIHYNTSEREAQALAETCSELGVQVDVIQGDFSTKEGLQRFIEIYLDRFPHTRCLVNNVGNYLVRSALETEFDAWLSLFQSNLFVPAELTRLLVKSLIAHQGSVVNIGVAGLEAKRADVYSSAYTASKGALLALTRSLAKELAPHQVNINMVSPGILDNTVDLPSGPALLPMGRAGTCQEVAGVVAFLLAPENRYVTGQNIEVAGGVRL